MNALVFTELLDVIEEKFGLEMVGKKKSKSQMESDGVCKANRSYRFSEMLRLLQSLSEQTIISINHLVLTYGKHFFSIIEKRHLSLLVAHKSAIEMLSSIENHTHHEVEKIYLDSDVPTFIRENKEVNSLVALYKSSSAMHHFELGLMKKPIDYFNATATIEFQKLKEDKLEVRFIIQKN